MGKIKRLELTAEQYAELEKGFRNGESHCFRMRCRAVLLKGKGLSSVKAGEQTEMSFVSVNAWVKRFLSEGIGGLQTRPGRGLKPIMDCSDEQAVRLAIEQDRQSVSKAKQAWQQATGKQASDITFKRLFSAAEIARLKNTASLLIANSLIVCRFSASRTKRHNATTSKVDTLFSCCILRNVFYPHWRKI